MGKQPHLSHQTIKVLGTLTACPNAELSGAQIAKQAKLSSGTLYPILLRLEEAGWLNSRWEDGDPTLLGRPRRRFYRVTPQGLKNIEQVVRELTRSAERPAWT